MRRLPKKPDPTTDVDTMIGGGEQPRTSER